MSLHRIHIDFPATDYSVITAPLTHGEAEDILYKLDAAANGLTAPVMGVYSHNGTLIRVNMPQAMTWYPAPPLPIEAPDPKPAPYVIEPGYTELMPHDEGIVWTTADGGKVQWDGDAANWKVTRAAYQHGYHVSPNDLGRNLPADSYPLNRPTD